MRHTFWSQVLACAFWSSLSLVRNSVRARAGRCGLRAHTVAVCAARPLRCDARRHRDRPQPTPPSASLYKGWRAYCGEPVASARSNAPKVGDPPPLQPRRVVPGLGAPLGRRVVQGLRPRAQRASLTDSSRLFERRARSAQNEFCDGPHDRATQGSRSAAKTATVKRPVQGPRALAASKQCARPPHTLVQQKQRTNPTTNTRWAPSAPEH